MESEQVILFDGVCNLCNGFVRFVIRHDRSAKFSFAAQQGITGQKLLQQNQIPINSYLVLVLTEKQNIFTESSAVLEIFRQLDGGWFLFYIFIIIPKFIRDFIYKLVARNRYQWFGKKNSCMMPLPGMKKRFLN